MVIKKEDNNSLPEWFRKELASKSELDDKMLARYDYMKEDFIAAIRQAAKTESLDARPETGKIADVVISLSGKVLKWAEDVVIKSMAAPPVSAKAMTRSVENRGREIKIEGVKVHEKIARQVDTVIIEATTRAVSNMADIEINLVDSETGLEKRPFSVSVFDDDGKELLPALKVGLAGLPPRFPAPGPGIFVFILKWESGKGELRIEFR